MNANKLFGIFLIIMVAVVVGLIFILQIPEKLNLVKRRPSEIPSSQTKVLTSNAQYIKDQLIKTAKKEGDLHLEDNEKFKIDYLISNDQFSVLIKKDPFVENKQAAEAWFISKGFAQKDLCFFRIFFVRSNLIKRQLSAVDLVPTGCDAPAIDGLAPSPK